VISANFGLLQPIKVILKDASFEAKRNGHCSDSTMLNLVCSEQIAVRFSRAKGAIASAYSTKS